MTEWFEIPLWAWVFIILGVIKWVEILIMLIKAAIAKMFFEQEVS